jgi:hypothetical protein
VRGISSGGARGAARGIFGGGAQGSPAEASFVALVAALALFYSPRSPPALHEVGQEHVV